MIRRPTWILLGIFAVLAAVVVYLQRNPIPASGSATPSPTAAPAVVTGLETSDITSIERKNSQGSVVLIKKDDQGNWLTGPEPGQPISAGKIEQIRAEIANMGAMAALEPGIGLEAVGLSTPQEMLVFIDAQSHQIELQIGGQTPTGTGYYVQVNHQAPVVVSKGSIDNLLALLDPAILIEQTPAPAGKEPPQPTPSS